MTRNLNAETIKKLTPLIQKIDDTLAKPQDERVDFTVQAMSPATLKSQLETYKAQIRPDWKGKFQMWHKRNAGVLQFRFHPPSSVSFKILTKDEEAEAQRDFTIIDNSPAPQTSVVLEMNDMALGQYVMMERPTSASFHIESLSKETQDYLSDPANAPEPALIKLLRRQGYTIQSNDTTLKVNL